MNQGQVASELQLENQALKEKVAAMTRAIARWSICCGWNCSECIDTLTDFITEHDQEAVRQSDPPPCDR